MARIPERSAEFSQVELASEDLICKRYMGTIKYKKTCNQWLQPTVMNSLAASSHTVMTWMKMSKSEHDASWIAACGTKKLQPAVNFIHVDMQFWAARKGKNHSTTFICNLPGRIFDPKTFTTTDRTVKCTEPCKNKSTALFFSGAQSNERLS